jgi:quercetin dioxygenase-like cupin family protein
MSALVKRQGEGRILTALGNRLTIRVGAEETGGRCSVIDFEVAPGFIGPPIRHRHLDMDWHGVVTEGEIRLELDGVEHLVPTGGVVYVPRGSLFRWRNASADRPARWVLSYNPGGFERYFVELAEAIGALPHTPSPQEVGAIAGPLWKRYGVEVMP